MMQLKAPKIVWCGRILSVIVIAIFGMSACMKFSQSPDLPKQMEALGIPLALITTLGILEILSTLLFAIPQTAVLGAIMLTGYLGGAIFTHLRIGEGVLVQVMLGVLVWTALYLRDIRVRQLIPLN